MAKVADIHVEYEKGWFKVHAKISIRALTPSPLSVIMTLIFLINSLEVSPKWIPLMCIFHCSVLDGLCAVTEIL